MASAKAQVLPEIEFRLGEMIDGLREHLHKYIDGRCKIIAKNTENAFETLLADINRQIQREIDVKQSDEAKVHAVVEELSRQIGELENYRKKLK